MTPFAAKKKRQRRPSAPNADSSVADSAVGTADTSRGVPSAVGAGTQGTGHQPPADPAPTKQSGVWLCLCVSITQGLATSSMRLIRARMPHEDVVSSPLSRAVLLSALYVLYDTWISGSDVNSLCCDGFVHLLDSW